MQFNPLLAISPIDGRYYNKLAPFSNYFSEYALLKYRIIIEIKWLVSLADNIKIKEIPVFSKIILNNLDELINKFNVEQALEIKKFEAGTNHDIKAIEYFLQAKLKKNKLLAPYRHFIHFACTSEDINNLAYALILKNSLKDLIYPMLNNLIKLLGQNSKKYASNAMLARTHGQAASPTTMGKELANFVARLKYQFNILQNLPILGKINGAVGNYNAHVFCYPDINWPKHCQKFIKNLGLNINNYTTQIEPHDYIVDILNTISHINNILTDLATDFWHYIALDYFKTKQLATTEAGSSTMPHKVNPINFENAEGNLGIANALSNFLSNKLPISRLQRDLSDSTVLRNLGVIFSHSYLAYSQIITGINKLVIHPQKLNYDLEQNYAVLAEAIQLIMKKYGIINAYEQVKLLTRGNTIDNNKLSAFIDKQRLPEKVKTNLKNLKPQEYIGLAQKLAEENL